jgi:hypothetical protein
MALCFLPLSLLSPEKTQTSSSFRAWLENLRFFQAAPNDMADRNRSKYFVPPDVGLFAVPNGG